MAEKKSAPNGGRSRDRLAYCVLIVAGLGILVLGGVTIYLDPANASDTFNVVLPVLASWVATVLVFYFGQKNFESANQQVQDMVDKLSPEQRGKTPVTAVMRRVSDITRFEIPAGKTDKDIKLSELMPKFSDSVTRLPVVDAQCRPKYMLHQSRIDKYLAGGGKADHTLEEFIAAGKKAGLEFGPNGGFAVVSEKTTLADAKGKITASCQDIFITRTGGSDEPLTGWISNTRLAKYLEP